MKKILVNFDCFGVICGEIAPYIFAKYFSDPEEAARLKDEFCHPADLGLIDDYQMLGSIAERIGIEKDALIEEWNSYICLNKDIIPLIEKLGEKADLALLSNAMRYLGERCVSEFGIDRLFDKVFLSYKYGIAKPDPAYYRLCIDSFGKTYDKIYMIDDNPKNLAPLKELGVEPVLFGSVEDIINHPALGSLLK